MDEFLDMMDQFLCALEGVFPECDATRQAHNMLRTTALDVNIPDILRFPIANKLIRSWAAAAEPYMLRTAESLDGFREFVDATASPPLSEGIAGTVNVRGKFLDAAVDDDARDVMREYVMRLNRLAADYVLYSSMPTSLRGSLAKVREDVETRAIGSSGAIDPSELLATMVESVASVMESMGNGPGAGDMESFSRALSLRNASRGLREDDTSEIGDVVGAAVRDILGNEIKPYVC